MLGSFRRCLDRRTGAIATPGGLTPPRRRAPPASLPRNVRQNPGIPTTRTRGGTATAEGLTKTRYISILGVTRYIASEERKTWRNGSSTRAETRVIDIDALRELKIGLVGGQVDVIAHDEPDARIEVHGVTVKDLRIEMVDGRLEIDHPQLRWDNFLEVFRNFGAGGPRPRSASSRPAHRRPHPGRRQRERPRLGPAHRCATEHRLGRHHGRRSGRRRRPQRRLGRRAGARARRRPEREQRLGGCRGDRPHHEGVDRHGLGRHARGLEPDRRSRSRSTPSAARRPCDSTARSRRTTSRAR